MVEPFGCVVMLHWRLHVYGASVPLSATPTDPSSLFYSPLSHALCSSLLARSHPPLPFSFTLMHSLTGMYRPASHPRTVDSSLKRNVIIGPCVIIVLPAVWQLHNSYQRGQCYNYAYMFLYIPRGYCSPIWSPFIKAATSGPSVPQSKEYRWSIQWSHRDQK